MDQPRPTPPPRRRVPPPAQRPAGPPPRPPAAAGASSGGSGTAPVFIGLGIGLGVILVPTVIIGLVYVFVSGRGGTPEERPVATTPRDIRSPGASGQYSRRPTDDAPPRPGQAAPGEPNMGNPATDSPEPPAGTENSPTTTDSNEVSDDAAPGPPNPPAEAEPDAPQPTGEEPADPDRESPQAPASGPLEDIRRREQLLPLPAIGAADTGDEAAEGVTLARILVDDPADCDLGIVGADSASGGRSFTIEPADEAGSREWTVFESSRVADPQEVACFRLADQVLSFHWAPGNASDRLRCCLLELVVSEGERQTDRAVCQLSEPVMLPPLELRFRREQYTIDFATADRPVSPANLPPADDLRLALNIAGLNADRFQMTGVTPLRAGRSVKIHVHPPDGSAGGFLELEVQFDVTEDHLGLHVKNFAYLPSVTRHGADAELNDSIAHELQPYCVREHRTVQTVIDGYAGLVEDGFGTFSAKRRNVEQEVEALEDLSFRSVEQSRRLAQLQAQSLTLQQAQPMVDKLRADVRSALAFLEEIERARDFLESSVTLHVRLFAEIDGRSVDFLRTAEGATDESAADGSAPGTDGEATEYRQ